MKSRLFVIYLWFLTIITVVIFTITFFIGRGHIILKARDVNITRLSPEVANLNIYYFDEVVYFENPYVIGVSKDRLYSALQKYLLFQFLFLLVSIFIFSRKKIQQFLDSGKKLLD